MLKALISPARDKAGGEAMGLRENLGDLLDLLQMVVARRSFLHEVWALIEKESEIKRNIVWKEFTALMGSGRLLSVAAEAEMVFGRPPPDQKQRWIGDGKLYASWLGRGVAEVCLHADIMEDAPWKSLSQMLSAAFRLGYNDSVVEGLVQILITPTDESIRLQKIVTSLPVHDKRSYMLALLRVISTNLRSHIKHDDHDAWWKHDATRVSGAAALLEKFLLHDDDFQSLIQEWITSSTGGGIGEPIALRRAIMAVISKNELAFCELSEKLLQQFGDQLWIKHTPIVRQEVNVQILLLCAGIAHRHAPSFMARLARSSAFLSGVSNRLSASSHRARFLGMVVGECFSSLVDKEETMQMSFGTEGMETAEGKWWKSIPMVDDKIGELKDLFSTPAAVVKKRKPTPPASSVTTTTAIQVIEESSSEDEFTPYAAPDSDPEDASDEDATTISRNKPSAPVYIRQLISYLHATESYDKQLLALEHASSLIRRKATSGKELASHLPDLLSIFAGIDNRFDIPAFDELRTAALVSLVATSPEQAGPWLAAQFFTGDYGLVQRATLLTAIGMGARELAGLSPPPTISAPQLPGKSHSIWSAPAPAHDLRSITASLKSMLLTPLAAKAADQLTGPSVLKIRTFSSRLAVEKNRAAPVHRKILDVVASAFFFPLVGGWWVSARDFGGKQVQAQPELLSLMVQTLAVLIHAAGPAAPRGMEMARECLEMVVGMLPAAAGEQRVLDALLLAALTVLEVGIEAADGPRRVAEELGELVVQVKGWAETAVEVGEEDTRALAAGVLVKIAEVEEGYRRILMGALGVLGMDE